MAEHDPFYRLTIYPDRENEVHIFSDKRNHFDAIMEIWEEYLDEEQLLSSLKVHGWSDMNMTYPTVAIFRSDSIIGITMTEVHIKEVVQ